MNVKAGKAGPSKKVLLYGKSFAQWNGAHPRFEIVSDDSGLFASFADSRVEAVVIHEGVARKNLQSCVGRLRLLRPEIEVLLCGDDASVIDKLTSGIDGFLVRGEDVAQFADAVNMVLARCCARKRRGRAQCQHTSTPHCTA